MRKKLLVTSVLMFLIFFLGFGYVQAGHSNGNPGKINGGHDNDNEGNIDNGGHGHGSDDEGEIDKDDDNDNENDIEEDDDGEHGTSSTTTTTESSTSTTSTSTTTTTTSSLPPTTITPITTNHNGDNGETGKGNSGNQGKHNDNEGYGKGNKSPKVIIVKIAPDHRTMLAGEIKPFTANVIGKGKIDRSVTWSVEGGDANGTITSNGKWNKKAIYEAPDCVPEELENGRVTIVATSVGDSTKSGTAKIKLIGTPCSSTTTSTTTTSTTTTTTTTEESSTTTTESSTTTSTETSTTTTEEPSTTTTTTEPPATTTTTTTTTETTTTTLGPTYTGAVKAILDTNCVGCHGGAIPPNISTYSGAFAAKDNIKDRVNRTDSSIMPPSGPLSPGDIATIDAWVAAGAPE